MTALRLFDDVLSQHIAIVGKTGSGKTYAAKGIVEHLLDTGRRVCVIDPTGVWYGLRAAADGAGPGFPVVIFGGDHADVPLADGAGERLGEIVATRAMPCVLDLSDFSTGAQQRFVGDFAGALYRTNRAPLYLVIDEADEFAPQNPLPETRRVLGHIDRIVRRGRVKGFRVILITQRPAVLHKNVLTQANALIALRLVAPQDRKALEAWIAGQADIEAGRAVIASLPKLPTGEGWIWAPEQELLERMAFPRIRTFDSGRAPTDEDALIAPKLAQVDAAELQALLAPADEDTEASGNSSTPDPAAIERAHEAGYREGFEMAGAQLRHVSNRVREIAEQLAALADGLADPAEPQPTSLFAVSNEGGKIDMPPAGPQPSPNLASHGNTTMAVSPREPAPRERQPASSGAGAELRLLRILAQWRPQRLSRQQLATLAGMSYRGGTFQTYLSRLRTAGYLQEADGTLAASAAGLAAAGDVGGPQTPGEVRAIWTDRLGPRAAGRLLKILADRGEQWSTRAQLAGWLGMTASGGTFQTYLSRLRRNGLIEERKGGLRIAGALRGDLP